MFLHSFEYTLKILLKNRVLVFWTLLFPIILGTFFKLAFSNIESNEKLNVIDIAIIDNEEFKNNQIYKSVFDNLGDKDNKEQMFNIKYTDIDEAKKLLEDDKIVGYLLYEDGEAKITFLNNGVNQTIFKYVVEEIGQTSEILNNTLSKEMNSDKIDYVKMYKKALEISNKDNVKLNNISSSNLSYTMIEFYTLIAMTCMYGGILSMTAVNQNLANMTNEGKRVSVAPTPKYKVLLGSLLSSYLIQLFGLLLLFVYTIFALKIDYGNNLLLVILLAILGSLAGSTLGLFLATVLKSKEDTKTGIIISTTMLGCFLAGMMGITMKYVIDTNVPILNKINPVAMITDGYYSLYYYDTLDRYIFNIISLAIFSLVLIVLSLLSLRRQKYDNI